MVVGSARQSCSSLGIRCLMVCLSSVSYLSLSLSSAPSISLTEINPCLAVRSASLSFCSSPELSLRLEELGFRESKMSPLGNELSQSALDFLFHFETIRNFNKNLYSSTTSVLFLLCLSVFFFVWFCLHWFIMMFQVMDRLVVVMVLLHCLVAASSYLTNGTG